MKTIIAALIFLTYFHCLAVEPNKNTQKAIKSLLEEPGSKVFLEAMDDNVLKRGKDADSKNRWASEMSRNPREIVDALIKCDVLEIDLKNIKVLLKLNKHKTYQKFIKKINEKYNTKDHCVILLDCQFKSNDKVKKEIMFFIFRKIDWKIIDIWDS